MARSFVPGSPRLNSSTSNGRAEHVPAKLQVRAPFDKQREAGEARTWTGFAKQCANNTLQDTQQQSERELQEQNFQELLDIVRQAVRDGHAMDTWLEPILLRFPDYIQAAAIRAALLRRPSTALSACHVLASLTAVDQAAIPDRLVALRLSFLQSGLAPAVCTFLEESVCDGSPVHADADPFTQGLAALRGLAVAAQREFPAEPLATWWIDSNPEISAFMARHAGHTDRTVAARAIQLALCALRFPGNIISQQMELQATGLLLQLGRISATNRRRIVDGAGADLALQVLVKAAHWHEALAAEAAALLGLLANNVRTVQRHIGVTLGAIPYLLEAVSRNAPSGALAFEALSAVCRLLMESQVRKQLVIEGVLPNFLEALEHWQPAALMTTGATFPPPVAEALRLLSLDLQDSDMQSHCSKNLWVRLEHLQCEAARAAQDTIIGPGVAAPQHIFGRRPMRSQAVVPVEDFPQSAAANPSRFTWRCKGVPTPRCWLSVSMKQKRLSFSARRVPKFLGEFTNMQRV